MLSWDFVLVLFATIFEFKGFLDLGPLFSDRLQARSSSTHPAKNDPMSAIQQIIKNHISQNKIAIFSKTYCPYCAKSKRLFESLNEKFVALELDKHPQGAEIQAELAVMTGQRTVPNIFINEKHIGGCDAVHKLQDEKQLTPLLK